VRFVPLMPLLGLAFWLLALCALAVLPASAAPGAGSEPEALTQAHALHVALDRRPVAQRKFSDYVEIARLLASVWRDPDSPYSDEALFDTATVNIALASDLDRPAAYRDAAGYLRLLLRRHPYSIYLRNAEWILAQLNWWNLDARETARAQLRDFLNRYPADPRSRVAQAELAGRLDERPPLLPDVAPTPRIGQVLASVQEHAEPGASRRSRPEEAHTTSESVATPRLPRLSPAASREESSAGGAKREAAAKPNAPASERRPVPESTGGAGERSNAEEPVAIRGVKLISTSQSTNVVVALDGPVKFERGDVPETHRVYFDLINTRLVHLDGRRFEGDDRRIASVHTAENRPGVSRVVVAEVPGERLAASINYFPNPPRIIIAIASPVAAASAGRHGNSGRSETVHANESPRPAEPEQPATVDREVKTAAPKPALEHAAGAISTLKPAHVAVAARSEPKVPAGNASSKTADLTPPSVCCARESTPRSLSRILGLKVSRIVIDAGHGGPDTGTIGPGGLQEKDVVLDVARRLGALLSDRLGARVIYTRSDDTFIPLEERTEIANDARADLFISIHVNSSPDHAARGVETYFLNLNGSRESLQLAERENATSNRSIHDLQDLIQKIELNDKLAESRQLAHDVESSLSDRLDVEQRGVKTAPFIVLIGARMPSILAEISFLSNRTDANLLRHEAYRQRIAFALYRGVAAYIRSMPGQSLQARLAAPGMRSSAASGAAPDPPAVSHPRVQAKDVRVSQPRTSTASSVAADPTDR
jgi:N-acetylmuramoyl-L-alanine amidase